MVQVTAVLPAFETVALNWRVCPANIAAVEGVTVTVTGGVKVMVAVAAFVASAWLRAVTVTVCCAVMLAGAVYIPVELMLPLPAGAIDHVTATLAVFVTVAMNCWVPPFESVAVVGATVTAMGGERVSVMLALCVASAWLVAVSVAVCCVAMVAGARYAVLMDPPVLDSDPAPARLQVTF